MSFKGFQKTVARAPQTIKAKFNMGEHSKDPVYIDAERRFQELEKETKVLHDESKKYFDAIIGMMNHQIEFSKAIAEIYLPISGRMSDPDSLIPDGNPDGIRACEEYEAICRDLLATLQPELEMIETRVIRPADELLEVIKAIRKTATKRDHKQLDYDRHRGALKKLQEKKERSLKDEKAMYKAENDVEQSTQDYNYYNDLLKEELPKLFALERDFIRPLFQSFYYMQLNVFYTLHEKMQSIDIGYFNLQLDIEEGFEAKRGDIKEQAEALSITKFKTTGAKRPPRPGPGGNTKLLLDNKPASGNGAGAPKLLLDSKPTSAISPTTPSSALSSRRPSDLAPPPPYSSIAHPSALGPDIKGSSPMARASSTGTPSWGSVAKSKGPAPPPPKPKPSRLSVVPAVETATALYDFEAQAADDLSFAKDDVIEIVSRTQNENEWWTGKLRGKQGQFPGNYVHVNT